LHAGFQGRWYANVRMAGIRSASDLLDVAGVLRADADGRVNPERLPDRDLIKAIARAAGAAEASTPAAAAGPQVAANGTSKTANGVTAGEPKTDTAAVVPAEASDLTDTLYVMCDALWPDPNIRYVLSYMGYELQEANAPRSPARVREVESDVATAVAIAATDGH